MMVDGKRDEKALIIEGQTFGEQRIARIAAAAPPQAMTPMDMLNAAVSRGADMAVLEKLMGLQERWESNNARKAFDAAIADAKAAIPRIVKSSTGHNTKYASFSTVAEAIDPVLSANGLSYRFRTAQGEKITVTCIIAHRDGHSEETSLSGAPDTGPGRNAIQAVGSSITYLMRYTLMAALGIAASADDDGKAANIGGTVTPGQIDQMQRKIMDTDSDLPRFLKYFKIEKLDDMQARDFDRAMSVLNKKGQSNG